jgi:hypothetical protein
VTPRPVDGVQVRDGFEDDRTRVQRSPLSTTVSGPIEVPPRIAALRSAGDIAIHEDGAVRVSGASATVTAARPMIRPRARLGVVDLLASRWGWRVLVQGAVLAGLVFLMTALPMLHWFSATTGPIGAGLLVRMLAAPLLASIFAGLMVASLIARTTARGLEPHEHP